MELPKMSKMEFFATAVNCFRKELHLRGLPAAKQSRAESLKLLISAHVLFYYCLKNNQ